MSYVELKSRQLMKMTTKAIKQMLLTTIKFKINGCYVLQMPVDYESQKHRGFAFVVYETSEDAFQAVDNMNDSEIA